MSAWGGRVELPSRTHWGVELAKEGRGNGGTRGRVSGGEVLGERVGIIITELEGAKD